MPRCTPCIIPYNGKVRQESFRVSGSMAACIVLFTKSSREGHDFAAIIFYSILVPNKRTYLFFLPLLFSNTHRQKALTLPRSGSSVVFLSLRGGAQPRRGDPSQKIAMFTKNSCRRHDSAAIIRYSIRVPRKNEDFSPITLSPLQTHTGKRP